MSSIIYIYMYILSGTEAAELSSSFEIMYYGIMMKKAGKPIFYISLMSYRGAQKKKIRDKFSSAVSVCG